MEKRAEKVFKVRAIETEWQKNSKKRETKVIIFPLFSSRIKLETTTQ